MKLDNDTRGWIMSAVSGIACIIGASIICVDILIRLIPSKRNFRIQESDAFMASSLSLSFGVMTFSALYSILPNSKKYLIESGYIASQAAWILLAGFAGGFFGIQIISRFLHQFIPSHVVDCDHTHEEPAHDHQSHNGPSRASSRAGRHQHRHPSHPAENGKAGEDTPLLPSILSSGAMSPHQTAQVDGPGMDLIRQATFPESRRQSMVQVQNRVMSFMKDTKTNCDSGGPCFGYTDPCGQECFKHITSRTPSTSRHSTILRSHTGPFHSYSEGPETSHGTTRSRSSTRVTRARSCESLAEAHTEMEEVYQGDDESEDEDLEAQHHHHVPENAFMSIGLQTSIAIAVHKLPEGFITYATNHANPSLGFSVFMALFVHNITEGFALALPLYLALKSRFQAMLWAALLGGASQPLGAGIAAAWFRIAGHEGHQPGAAVYGVMFALTGGVMTSVGLSLFVESLSMNHNRNLCISFGFCGMAIMAASNALTS
ncbi:related to vacuolar zinc efflux protein [Rhynchosporium agropyri]|uniref:Related to vacuolar zinc efflux protein n=1 Tax=Rhynchosporium agropyri TaxID=914238 RepID=A0A1E1KT86_9HELO|nr:related to vacuolar zinc efflux protein [Rhynchosporium agropyri]